MILPGTGQKIIFLEEENFKNIPGNLAILLCELSVTHCAADVSVLGIDNFFIENPVQKTHCSVFIGSKAQVVISATHLD